MRSLIPIVIAIALASCEKSEDAPTSLEAGPESISYSREIRPLLIDNCVQCHADLPLHAPLSWDLLHSHSTHQTPGRLQEWVNSGSPIDGHWAFAPITSSKAKSLNDFVLPDSVPLDQARQAPPPSFNASIEQLIAGDLLEDNASALFTGYFRKGEDTPAFRLSKAARGFLGLRFDCAQCHDHPSEPISTGDYQTLLSLFTTPFDHQRLATGLRPPIHVSIDEKTRSHLDELLHELDTLRKPPFPDPAAYQSWLGNQGDLPQIPGLVAAYSFDQNRLTNLAPNSPVKEHGENLTTEPGVHGMGLRLNSSSRFDLTGTGITDETVPFSISLWVQPGPTPPVDASLVTIGPPDRGFQLRVSDGKIQARWTRAWPQIAIGATSKIPLLAPSRWGHIVVTSDGSRSAKGIEIYFNGHAIDSLPFGDRLIKPILTSPQPVSFHGNTSLLDEIQLFDHALTPIAATHLFDGRSLTGAFNSKEGLTEFYARLQSRNDTPRRTLIAQITHRVRQLEAGLPEYLVMRHQPFELPTSSPESLPFLRANNRLEFARNLNQNLLARVMANEVWRSHFGTPLTHDFGYSGALPDHPELLEWLAAKLTELEFKPNQLAGLIQRSELWRRSWPHHPDQRAQCPRTSN